MAQENKNKKAARFRFDFITIILIALVIVLVALMAYYSVSKTGVTSIGLLKLTYNPNATFSLNGGAYIAYVYKVSNSSSASIYLEKEPILLNPILQINISSSSAVFVNPSMGNYASMEIKLISASSSAVDVSVSSVSPSLSIPVSSSDIQVLQHVYVSHAAVNSTSTKPSSNSSIAKNTSSTSTTTTTIAKSSANTTKEGIMAIAENYSLFKTLQDYASAYSNLSRCTPALYNSTYLLYTGSYPSGASTYYNASAMSPYNLTYSIRYVNSTTYSLVFNTISDSSLTTGTAALIYVDLPGNAVSGYKLEGAYTGLTPSALASTYTNYTKIGGYCSVLV